MPSKVNTSVSLEPRTIEALDAYAQARLGGNRSLAIEEIVRQWLELRQQRDRLENFINNLPEAPANNS